ncbi:unnamed protein product [Cuscuta epithymum]|uniref:GrpE protein homolog n=1 Tax=Cuscuta epithymum TaxID=186058 RepID=A0AAV0FKM9_9ASTE|nr:unnamed protein product [Cuscuta epithymum]
MAACRSSSFCTLPFSPSKSAQTPVYHNHILLHKPVHGTILPLATEYKCNSVIVNSTKRSLPRAVFTPKDSAPKTNSNEADEKNSTSLTSLVQVYKVALFNGDMKGVSKVEAMMCQIEKEKTMLAERVSALSDEIKSGKAKYMRLQADFENFRKRYDKEKSTIRSDSEAEIIENLLPIVDTFESAKQQTKLETEREKNIDKSYQGIYKQFVEIMRSLQVTVVPTVGKPFDPSLHEAIAREESNEFREGVITQEYRRGFRLGNRLLRPAVVKVSSGSGNRKRWPVPQQSVGQQGATDGTHG